MASGRLALSIFGLAAAGLVLAAGSKAPGQEAYTPSKQEWLAVELNAVCRQSDPLYDVTYSRDPRNPNGLLLDATHASTISVGMLDDIIKLSRGCFDLAVKTHGWYWASLTVRPQAIKR